VTVLVIACPHALGLAVPLVVAINTSMAASNGMLIRDRIAMEEARNLDVVVFDKTGTLTKGEGIVDVTTTGTLTENEALTLMAAVETDSEHMIGEAILSEVEERGPPSRTQLGSRRLRAVASGRQSTRPPSPRERVRPNESRFTSVART